MAADRDPEILEVALRDNCNKCLNRDALSVVLKQRTLCSGERLFLST